MTAFVLAALLAVALPAACPVTTPLAPGFVPPSPLDVAAPEDRFWYGTPRLWTWLSRDGRSIRRDKSFWWSPDYSRAHEQQPDLRVVATSLTTGVVARMQRATNAPSASLGGWAMLTMLEFPSAGCWSVTTTYRDYSVTFVTLVP
jgi:hypothetical protein